MRPSGSRDVRPSATNRRLSRDREPRGTAARASGRMASRASGRRLGRADGPAAEVDVEVAVAVAVAVADDDGGRGGGAGANAPPIRLAQRVLVSVGFVQLLLR